MRNILFILLISFTSCVIPQHIESDKCCDKQTCYEPYFATPPRVIVINKNKPTYKKRHVKVKINKHRKRK